MRAIWKGAVAFGLVNVPVKLYAATGEHSVPLHQVHRDDGGRIRYRKVCSVCGEEVGIDAMAKGYQTDDGGMVVLTDEDLDELPLATEREIAVEEFVPAEQVDPIMLAKTYYLEPEKTAAKPYALLREALKTTDRMAVVKVALRQRESMAVLRVRDDVICLQTLLWPDEVREADFPILDTDVQVRPQELQMASSLVESLAADFDPSAFEDSYQAALESLIEAKVTSGRTVQVAQATEDEGEQGGEVVDLLSALQRSVEKARGARAGGAASRPAGADGSPAAAASGGSSRPRKSGGAASAGGAKASRTSTRSAGTSTDEAGTDEASTAKTSTARTSTARTSTAKDSTAKASTGRSSTTRAGAKATTAEAARGSAGSTASGSRSAGGSAKEPAAKASTARSTGTRGSAASSTPAKAKASGGRASKAADAEPAKKATARRRAS
ncbi:Ku protein [Actinotalea subterranea]|uniref:non-homologous end joining protein Ku n=1 Tax=Actinotalea subterranea TaxID=2607497 RepID=UPI0011F09188|nr:Ku protein [Actinotalea subterranea]